MNSQDIIKAIKKKKEEKEKFPKEAVLYSYRPETNYTCGECVFAKDKATKCALYGPGENIKPEGSCGLWLHADPDSPLAEKVPYLGLITKVESGYTENKNGFTCGRCEYFLPKQQGCKKVRKDSDGDTPGIISADACCNRWEADDERGPMTDKQLEAFLAKL